jgi:hypothetical protein
MRELRSLHGLLQAPNLRELELAKKINISETDVAEIIGHAEAIVFASERKPCILPRSAGNGSLALPRRQDTGLLDETETRSGRLIT